MKTMVITVPNQPGKSHTDSIVMSAETALGMKVISEMPAITVEKAKLGRSWWKINITIPEVDYPFWLGYVCGKNFALNNRQLVLAE